MDSCTQLLHWQLSLKMMSGGVVQRNEDVLTYRNHMFGLEIWSACCYDSEQINFTHIVFPAIFTSPRSTSIACCKSLSNAPNRTCYKRSASHTPFIQTTQTHVFIALHKRLQIARTLENLLKFLPETMHVLLDALGRRGPFGANDLVEILRSVFGSSQGLFIDDCVVAFYAAWDFQWEGTGGGV